MTDRADLPAEVRRLWGLEDTSPRPRAALTLTRIVDAAIAVAVAEGLDALSMKRVATDLGVTTMALYRHVASKDELLELMADRAAGEPPDIALPPSRWREALERWTTAMREVLRTHRWVVDIPISGPPVGPNSVAWTEAGLQALAGTGLSVGERFGVFLLVSTYVRSDAVLSVQLERGLARSGQRSQAEVERDYGRQLAALVGGDPRFPELSAVVDGGLFDVAGGDDDVDPDADFRFGLDRILDGVAVLVDARGQDAG